MDQIAKEKIKSIVGINNFSDSDEDKLCYSYDATAILHHLPEAVVFPENEDQISSLMKLANEVPFNIVPRGAGTGLSGNAGGLRGLKYGVTKNYIMGTEMILPIGDLLKTGGKNVKDVAGYNLRDFIVGSEGTLGIITKILLKLIPLPTGSVTLLAYFDKLSDCARSVSDIISAHLTPCMMEFLDNTTINCVEDYTKIGLPRNSEAILLIEVDGRGSIVQEDAETPF